MKKLKIAVDKLADTVAWLDREIKGAPPNDLVTDLITKFAKLRDDLAETLRKIEGD